MPKTTELLIRELKCDSKCSFWSRSIESWKGWLSLQNSVPRRDLFQIQVRRVCFIRQLFQKTAKRFGMRSNGRLLHFCTPQFHFPFHIFSFWGFKNFHIFGSQEQIIIHHAGSRIITMKESSVTHLARIWPLLVPFAFQPDREKALLFSSSSDVYPFHKRASIIQAIPRCCGFWTLRSCVFLSRPFGYSASIIIYSATLRKFKKLLK